MTMSDELKSNTLLDSQVVEQGQDCEDTEIDGLYAAAVAILQQKTFDALDREGANAALSTLEDFYSQYEIVKGFQYYALKVSFLIKLLSSANEVEQINAIDSDSIIEEIESIISVLENDENADSDAASSLIRDFKDDLKQMKLKLEFVKDFNHVNEQIQELRDPKKIMMGSKVEDTEKAFSLWDDFYERNELEKNDDYYQLVTQIYNSLFYALTIHQNELKKLPVTQFSHYCFDAKECAIKAVKLCEDEDKSEWLALQERIGEQVEELKKLYKAK